MNNLVVRTITAMLAALFLMGSTVYAETNDWTRIREFPCSFEDSERVDSFTPNGAGDALFFFCERGLDVYLWVRADDLRGGDHRGAAAQIRYFVKGRTKQDRRIAAFDPAPNDKPVIRVYKARVNVLGLQGRACLSKRGKRNTVAATTCDRYR